MRFFEKDVACDDGEEQQSRADDVWKNEGEFGKEPAR
jgi:hypothetical protein